ncbi:hypothetical protein HPP92_011162 [Vanilla planifolia]|uniref:Uncharacterized protein n=1 Tax=Vanilla planifolia TaxID=51239 RepID=A0A835QX27_VANPL|nr:hypothetical protein HPP92_011162 [Vanilla planifolia]
MVAFFRPSPKLFPASLAEAFGCAFRRCFDWVPWSAMNDRVVERGRRRRWHGETLSPTFRPTVASVEMPV